MRMNTEPAYVETNNVGETKRATIQTSSKIFNFFSKQIYSNFYTAAWRELVANAIDAQRMTGETRPPVVTAPSMLDPYAKVRDFGCSMDHEFMMNKFMAFGDASTKDGSDDFIGGFGIGSKAPLAYTDQYSIRCYLDGVVRVYSIFKDEEDCPSIAFLSEDTTDEPNGVEVGFPVRQDDIEKFTASLVDTLQYFDPMPILENTEHKLEPVKYDARGDRWGIRTARAGDNRIGRIIIGGVAYPLNVGEIGYDYPNLRSYSRFGLDLFLDIGEANIALSREHVTHDEKLLSRLEEIIKGIGDEYGAQISKKFENLATKWEAKALLRELTLEADPGLKNVLQNHCKWKGQKLSLSINAPELPLVYVAYGDYYGWGSSDKGNHGIPTTEAVSPRFRAWTDNCRFMPHTFDMIVWDDGPDKPSLRVRKVIDEYPNKRILFVRDNTLSNDDDPVTLQQFLDAIGNPPSSLVTKLSEYDPLKIVRAAAGTATRQFTCYIQSSQPYHHSTRHSTLPADGGMYVVMNNFNPESTTEDVNIALRSNPNNVVWLNLTDFRASGVEDDPNWYSVEEGVKRVKAEYRKTHKDLPEAQGWYLAQGAHEFIDSIEELSQLPDFPKRGPLLQILRLHEKHDDVTDNTHAATRETLLGVDGSAHRDKIIELANQAQAKHPLLFELMDNYHMNVRASDELKNRLF